MHIADKIFNSDFDSRLSEILQYFDEIYSATGRFNQGCGSYLFDGRTYVYNERSKEKQVLIYELAKQTSHVLEIGVYMGHSLAIMLAANNKLKATVIDTDNSLPAKAVELLTAKYPDSQIEFINSDSNAAMSELIDSKFDLFHIDGDHNNQKVQKELDDCFKLSLSNNFRVIFDDIEISSDSFESFLNDRKILDKHICTCYNPAGFYEVEL
jgi:hypothetical protein